MSDTFQAEPPPPKKRGPLPFLLLGCGGVFLLVVVACGGLIYLGIKQADQVAPEVDKLFAAIDDGTYADAYRSTTTPNFRTNVSPQEFELIAEAVREHLGPLQSKSFRGFNTSTDENGTTSEVTYAATFAQGNATLTVRYRGQGERWLLDELTIDAPSINEHLAASTCPHCDTMVAASAAFCPNCGESLRATGGGATKGSDPGAADDSKNDDGANSADKGNDAVDDE